MMKLPTLYTTSISTFSSEQGVEMLLAMPQMLLAMPQDNEMLYPGDYTPVQKVIFQDTAISMHTRETLLSLFR